MAEELTQSQSNSSNQNAQPVVVKPEKPFEKPEDLVSWDGPDRVFKNRSSMWFVGLALAAAISLVFLVWYGQWTLAVVVVAVVFVLITVNLVEPQMREYIVTTVGVKFGKKLYSYDDLDNFWLVKEENGEMTLNVKTLLDFPHILEIPLGSDEGFVQSVETNLLKYIPYHEQKKKDLLSYLDLALDKVGPYLPKFLVNWYSSRFNRSN